MGEKGKTTIAGIRLCKIDSERYETHDKGYYCVVYAIGSTPPDHTEVLMRYSASPFKGSHRATQRSNFTACYTVADETIEHIAFGRNSDKSCMYYSLELINVQS